MDMDTDMETSNLCDNFQEGNLGIIGLQKRKSCGLFQAGNDDVMDMVTTYPWFLFQKGNDDVRNITSAVKHSSTVLGDLDFSSIEMVFCHLSPLNVFHMASVCQLWSSAASSSLVWRSLLPSGCISYLNKAFLQEHSEHSFSPHSKDASEGGTEDGLEDGLGDELDGEVKTSCNFSTEVVKYDTKDVLGKDSDAGHCSKACGSAYSNLKASTSIVNFREIYRLFSRGCSIEEGRQLIRVDTSTNSLSLYVSVVSGMEATWSYGEQTYIKSKIPNPIFPQSAILLLDVSFCLNGHISCWLPPGLYSLYWRLARDLSEPDLEESRICSRIYHNVKDGECITREFPLSCVKIGGWEEVFAGDFFVTGQEEGGLCLFELYLSLHALDTIWSSFINIDSFSFRKLV